MRVGIEDVAGVADRRFADARWCRSRTASIATFMFVGRVQRVEDAEDVDAVVRAPLDERADDVVRVVRVADGVARAQQHLEQDVRDPLPQLRRAGPTGSSWRNRIDVSNVAPPHISRLNRSGISLRHRVGDRQHVVGAHARRQQRLVRVAHRRVGDQQPALARGPTARTSPAPAPAACCRMPAGGGVDRCETAATGGVGSLRAGSNAALHVRPAVDDDVAEVATASSSRGRAARGTGTAPACRR